MSVISLEFSVEGLINILYINFLLTGREGHMAYWPDIGAVKTKWNKVCAAANNVLYATVWQQAKLVSSPSSGHGIAKFGPLRQLIRILLVFVDQSG